MSRARGRAAWFVPGRIEVLGKHTDYAGGRSLLAAVDRGHTVTGRPRDDDRVRVTSTAAGRTETIEVPLHDGPAAGGSASQPAGHWSGYVRTVVDRLSSNFPGMLGGADVEVTSDLPLAAGMSSSSALVVGLALTLMDLAGIAEDDRLLAHAPDREHLAEYLGCVENGQSFHALTGRRGVGTFGGSEDHTAMLCGERDHLVQYAFGPVRREASVPFPADLAFVVAVSGVRAEKTGAARERYNSLATESAEIMRRWRAATGRDDGSLGAAAASAPDAPERLRRLLRDDERLLARCEQFLGESEEIVPAAARALAAGDLAELGRLADRSHHLAETALGNQVPATSALQSSARELGAHAASAFGAGFGGSVWALVDASDAEGFASAWLEVSAGTRPQPDDPAFSLVTRPGPPAHRL